MKEVDVSEEGKGEEWEDCDYEDMDSDEAEKEIDAEDIKLSDKDFVVVDAGSSSSFSIVDKPPSDKVDSSIKSLSSIQSGSKKGLSKDEVMLGLQVKKAERLPTGEVKLGNGKIMGVRKFHYIYK